MNYELIAKQLRTTMLDASIAAGRGHLGGSFSCVEILVALYYGGALSADSNFILSKGHAGLALYSVLEKLGRLPVSLVENFCKPGSVLSEHPSFRIPGVSVTSGSLGNGLGIGLGMALANSGKERVFVLMGDGECQEGSVWEAARYAAELGIGNLWAIVDLNGLRSTDEIHGPDVASMFNGFGWRVLVSAGHNVEALIKVLNTPSSSQPTVILANTIKGRGISFMEGKAEWHNGIPTTAPLLSKAYRDLR